LKARTGLVLKVPGLVTQRGVRGPTVLRAHLDTQGEVVKMALLESCGNADLDESAMQALRVMKFAPYTLQGVPADVTLVVPVHIPKRLGRSH
jgi:TonB family protein